MHQNVLITLYDEEKKNEKNAPSHIIQINISFLKKNKKKNIMFRNGFKEQLLLFPQEIKFWFKEFFCVTGIHKYRFSFFKH